jgi:hypothetical protein
MTIQTEPSICIPRTLNNVGWRDVKETFELLFGKGTIERVDIVSKRNSDDPFCKIFVHFRYWPDDTDTQAIRKRLLDGDTIKVVYDAPWFWKCSASRTPKPERNTPRAAPYIEVDEKKVDVKESDEEQENMEEMTDAMLKDDIVERA